MNPFERYISLKERTVSNTLYVSLNFDPALKLSNEKMIEITERYMDEVSLLASRKNVLHTTESLSGANNATTL